MKRNAVRAERLGRKFKGLSPSQALLASLRRHGVAAKSVAVVRSEPKALRGSICLPINNSYFALIEITTTTVVDVENLIKCINAIKKTL